MADATGAVITTTLARKPQSEQDDTRAIVRWSAVRCRTERSMNNIQMKGFYWAVINHSWSLSHLASLYIVSIRGSALLKQNRTAPLTVLSRLPLETVNWTNTQNQKWQTECQSS